MCKTVYAVPGVLGALAGIFLMSADSIMVCIAGLGLMAAGLLLLQMADV